jgi:hypothetical protein
MSTKNTKEVFNKERITSILLSIINIAGTKVKNNDDYEEVFRKELKFQKKTDWLKYRACVDLIDDTELAIIDAFEYQLGYLKRKVKKGEIYLRLYGILNAVYLQMNAIYELTKLTNYPNPKKIDSDFQNLNIYKLRGMAASHTTDYLLHNDYSAKYTINSKTTSFRIYACYIEETGSDIKVIDDHRNIFEFNLLEILTEYENLQRELLIQLINHVINKLVYTKDVKIELKARLNEIVPNLIDYSTINKNKEFKKQQIEKIKNIVLQPKTTLLKSKGDSKLQNK